MASSSKKPRNDQSSHDCIEDVEDLGSDYDTEDEKRGRVKQRSITRGKATASETFLQLLNDSAPGVFARVKDDKSLVRCTTCNTNLLVAAGKKDVLRHLTTAKHKSNEKALSKQQTLFAMGVTKSNTDNSENDKSRESVLKGEVMLSQYICKTNTSFNSSAELVK